MVRYSELRERLLPFWFCVLTANSVLNTSVNRERGVDKQILEIPLITVNRRITGAMDFFLLVVGPDRNVRCYHGKNRNWSKVSLKNPTGSNVTIIFTCDIFRDIKKI